MKKKILIIVILTVGFILISRTFFINKLPLNLLNDSIMNLDNENDFQKSNYKVIRLNDVVETVKKEFYTVYYTFNSLGMKIKGEKRPFKKEFGDGYKAVLNGSQWVKNHLMGEAYIDEGVSVYDKNGNKLNADIDVQNNININKKGTYYIKYIVKYNGASVLFYRSVEVIDVPSCDGIINRYGTTLIVDKYDSNKLIWEIDGEIINDDSKLELAYKKISRASVIVYGKKVNCNIKNNMVYDFKYDSKNEKPYIGCKTYDADDKVRLESILKNAVNEAGYETRAGVVEAARFLVGGLEYKVKYTGPKQADWRIGKYPYAGLNIAVYDGWGCKISGWTQGMDCTNFTSWAFAQAGLKVDSVYSTKNVYSITDVVDKIKVGDLLLTPNDSGSFSHVGIVIGIDENSIYVAEAKTSGIDAVVATRLDKSNLPTKGNFSKVRLYEYENEGNVTNMWVS